MEKKEEVGEKKEEFENGRQESDEAGCLKDMIKGKLG